MNNCKLHNGNIKLSGYKGGRGYCGYYTTHFGKKIFLRSTQEFMYAKYLDSKCIYYLTENITYIIDNKTYKPDFFVYDGNFIKLSKIVEIKYSSKEKLEYQEKYASYFSKIGINYEVISKSDMKHFINKNVVSKLDITMWISEYVKNYNTFSYCGDKNPMYGIKHSDITKLKIGDKTREYFKDPVVRKRHHDARVLYWNSPDGLETKHKYSNLRTLESRIKNPTIIQVCIECGNNYIRKVKDRYHKETCSNSCRQKQNWKNGTNVYCGNAYESYKSKLKKYFSLINNENITSDTYDDVIKYQKQIGNIPKHFGMNICIVEKYFGSLTNLKEEIKNKQNK